MLKINRRHAHDIFLERFGSLQDALPNFDYDITVPARLLLQYKLKRILINNLPFWVGSDARQKLVVKARLRYVTSSRRVSQEQYLSAQKVIDDEEGGGLFY